jgi:hypothetical protein
MSTKLRAESNEQRNGGEERRAEERRREGKGREGPFPLSWRHFPTSMPFQFPAAQLSSFYHH